jgi:CHASE2 domain-containing sensor protein
MAAVTSATHAREACSVDQAMEAVGIPRGTPIIINIPFGAGSSLNKPLTTWQKSLMIGLAVIGAIAFITGASSLILSLAGKSVAIEVATPLLGIGLFAIIGATNAYHQREQPFKCQLKGLPISIT